MAIKDRLPRRREQFWYLVIVGLMFIYFSGSTLVEYRKTDNLVRVSGVVDGSRIVHVPKNTQGRNSEHFDFFVYLKGSNSPYLFKSFELSEPQRLSDALQVGQFAELDVSRKRNRIWGVTSDGVMVLSPSVTSDSELKDTYFLLGFGIACLFGSVLVRAWPKSRNPHDHFR